MEQKDSAILTDLQVLVDSSTRGDPQSPLCWTSKSVRRVAEELSERGHAVSHQTVAALLDDLGYSLQANRKTKEGQDHADRDAQFEYISRQVRAFQEDDQPAISVDAKKKENIGDFRNPGREWHRRRRPEEVRAKDFPDKRLGKAIPEGVYDLSRNEGWVSVGVDHDTAEFAGVSIRRWWEEMGSLVYPGARRLLITADAGGSNGYRPRCGKWCCRVWRTTWACGSRSAISRRARASGTRSSTACFATSRRTGVASRFAREPSSST